MSFPPDFFPLDSPVAEPTFRRGHDMKPVSQLLPICLAVLLSPVCLTAANAQDDAAAKKKADAKAAAQKAADDKQAQDEKAAADAKAAADKAAVIKGFTKQLSGSSLVGQFTLDDAPADKALKPDRYQIATVNHVSGDSYLFVYLHKGVPIPLSLKVLWAGKTPVITLDDFTIAGMGTFSARVMFHGDRYAGTWQHGKKGGLMFGKIEKPKKPGTASATKPAEKKPAGKAPK